MGVELRKSNWIILSPAFQLYHCTIVCGTLDTVILPLLNSFVKYFFLRKRSSSCKIKFVA